MENDDDAKLRLLIAMAAPSYEWQRTIEEQHYLISNKAGWLSHDFINQCFDRDEMNWTTSMPLTSLATTLANSCTLGLYASRAPFSGPSQQGPAVPPTQIGFARLITDYVTLAYLTDVFILPEYQGKGLGRWLIGCVRDVIDAMPELRRALLLTGVNGKGVQFYERELNMKVFHAGDEDRVIMMYRKA